MAQLDKFKRRLIRSVARLRVDEKKPDKDVWEILNKEMGCDCGPLWDRMRALTLKKLSRLLVCADRTDMIASVARPSATDMLMFDLVLAHDEDVDVIGRDVILEKATDYKALEELFELVQEFSLEETPAVKLAETWEDAVRYYEKKRDRLTSQMLLQRRWYQLKELTRSNFYQLWQKYRGNAQFWTRARKECSLTDLQVAIAERYPYVITKPFPKWDQLIKAGLVVLPHQFEQKAPEKSDSSASGNEQDLVLVEPEVETIDLGVDSDSDPDPGDSTVLSKSEKVPRQTDNNNPVTAVAFDPNITIKTEPPDSDGLSNVKILEATHIPTRKLGNTRKEIIKTEDLDPRIALKNDILRNISKCIESTDELIKQCDPQEDQSENVQNALSDVEHQMENIIGPCSSMEIIENEPEFEPGPQTTKDSKNKVIQGKAVDYFRKKIVEEMSKSSICEEFTDTAVQERNDVKLNKSNAPEDTIAASLSPEKENTADGMKSSDEEEVLEDIIKQTADDFVNKSKQNRAESSALTLTDLTIVDDGIAFVDDCGEYEDDEDKKNELDADNGTNIESEKQENATASIDLKLLMTPVVCTIKLDNMCAFQGKEFNCVVDKSTIDFAELESKPKQTLKEAVSVKQENKSNANDSDREDSVKDDISEDLRIKPTSSLLQKPKKRTYNPIQLCKNPDFNTRLKRLTFGFLSSERNRRFLSACKPATIDLHKAFEEKLVNGTLYLKRSVRSDFVKESSVKKDDQSVRTVSVVPSAISVQSLLDQSKINFQPPMAVSSIDLTSEDMTERNKVIHLPDITQVRRINQKLLTAEVPPIRVQSNVCTITQPSVDNRVEIINSVEQKADITQKPNHSDSSSHGLDKNNAPLLSNLLLTHKPPSFPKIPPKNAHILSDVTLPAMTVSAVQKKCEKQVDKTQTNPDKPPRKQPVKQVWPPITWNKPVVCNRPLDDFLITHDTLLKMLAKAKNQPESSYSIGYKNSVNVYKKTEKGAKGPKKKQKVTKNMDAVKNQEQLETKDMKVIENHKDSKNNKVKNPEESRVRAKKGITKTICCWARAWVFKSKGQLLRLPRHMCPFPECNCCCKDELSRPKSKGIVDNDDPIELSDGEHDTNLTSVSKTIESVVQQSTQVPIPKLRVYPSTSSAGTQKNKSLEYTVVESFGVSSEIKNTSVDTALHDVVIDDNGSPVANVQGEVLVVAHDAVTYKSVNEESRSVKPNKIFVIPEARLTNINESNPKSNEQSSSHVFGTVSKKTSTQNHVDLNRPTLSLSSSVSKKMYVKAIYSKPSQKPPSASMSTQTMDVPLLQNLSIEPEVKYIMKSDVAHQKELVIDGTRPFTTPSTLVDKQDQVIYLKASQGTSDNPIYLGKNKILLTTVKFPSNLESHKKENLLKENTVTPKVVPTFPLPEGVEIVLQPNGELTCMVKHGVELDHTQISVLPSILEAVKQQINTQQPFVVGDVINLSDDESEKKNKNAFENIQKEGPSIADQLVKDTDIKRTNEIDSQENLQKQTKQSEFLTQQEHVKEPSTVCYVSPENKTEETENLSENQNHKETKICNVHDGDKFSMQSQICNDYQVKGSKKRDEEQQNRTQSDNNKCEENKFNERDVTKHDPKNDKGNRELDNINVEYSSEVTESDHKETHENNERSVGSRNLLSDLMEMSGISEEDIKTAPDASTPTLPAVINIDPDNVAHHGNLTNPFPDLSPVTSIAQLKYACEQNGKFFKLDFESGTLAPISVCIKKKGCPAKLQNETVEFAVKETGLADKVGIPVNHKVGFPANRKVGIPANSKIVIPAKPKVATSSTFAETSQPSFIHRIGRNKRKSMFSKPITILRHTRPQSLLRGNILKKIRAFKRQRKETGVRIEAKIDLVDSDAPMEEEYLINSESDDDDILSISDVPGDRIAYKRFTVNNTVTEVSDDSSDDEPLALKSKRMKLDVSVPTQVVTETVNNSDEKYEKNIREFLRCKEKSTEKSNEDVEETEIPVSDIRMPEPVPKEADNLEVDTDLDTGTAAILEEPLHEPEDDSIGYESSAEDAILGM